MKLIILHDHLNPNREVVVDSDSITSITSFGSGSSIVSGMGTVLVHETPEQITPILDKVEERQSQ